MSEHFQGVATKLKKKKMPLIFSSFLLVSSGHPKLSSSPQKSAYVLHQLLSVIFNAYLRLFISTSCLWVLWASSHKLAVRFSAKHVDREFFGDVISPDAVKFSPV